MPPTLPSKPTKFPYEPTEKNIPKLKQYLLDKFASTTFNTEGFPTMDTKPAHIHINDEATPYVRHTPIPVPFHLKEAVKNSLIMQPFRSLVKRNNKFYSIGMDTGSALPRLKEHSISAVEDGIRAFDYQHTTCLQTDWSKEGISFLLL